MNNKLLRLQSGMKIFSLLILVIFSGSCSKSVELDGNWLILDMMYKGKAIYPTTKFDQIEIALIVPGYEGAEKIEFHVSDSVAVFPGFHTTRSQMAFSIDPNNQFLTTKSSLKDMNITDSIFNQKYDLLLDQRSVQLTLKSENTTINLIREEHLIKNRINEMLNF